MMAYGAAVGSERARRKSGAVGFIGNATDATAHYFGRQAGLGTMPHALIGFAGSTLRAAEMFHESFPAENLTVLVDYFGKEVTDAIKVCQKFADLASLGRLAFRIETPGGRVCEGLAYVMRFWTGMHRRPFGVSHREERHLIGPVFLLPRHGICASNWMSRFRQREDRLFKRFSPEKCNAFAIGEAPVDIIGTGSFLPERWTETYATADIVEYDGVPRVKVGREFLLRR